MPRCVNLDPYSPTNVTVVLFPVKGSRATREDWNKDFFIHRDVALAKLGYKIRSRWAAPRVRKRPTPTRKSGLKPASVNVASRGESNAIEGLSREVKSV